MAENIVRYEGSETVEAPGSHWEPIIVKEDNLPLQVGIGITLGLTVTALIYWASKKTTDWLAPDIGDNPDDFLTAEFSAQLGILNGALAGMPVKYKWLPVSRSRRRGHPASIDIELKVNNPRGARLRVHKEGPFSKPMGSLPPEIETPPLTESLGFVIRMEPEGALDSAAMKGLDSAFHALCAGDLYEARLEKDTFFFSLIRNATYEIEEAKALMAAAARAAALFN